MKKITLILLPVWIAVIINYLSVPTNSFQPIDCLLKRGGDQFRKQSSQNNQSPCLLSRHRVSGYLFGFSDSVYCRSPTNIKRINAVTSFATSDPSLSTSSSTQTSTSNSKTYYVPRGLTTKTDERLLHKLSSNSAGSKYSPTKKKLRSGTNQNQKITRAFTYGRNDNLNDSWVDSLSDGGRELSSDRIRHIPVEQSSLQHQSPPVLSNLKSYESILECARQGHANVALEAFTSFLLSPKNSSSTLSIISFNKLIKEFGEQGNLVACKATYSLISSNGLQPTLVTFTTLIAKAGMWKQVMTAEFYFDEMQKLGVQPDAQVYNSLINVYSKSGDSQKATQCFQDMLSHSLRPTVVTFNTLIDSFARAGLPANAQDMLHKMIDYGITPNLLSYSSLIHAYCRSGRIDKALDILHNMESQNVQGKASTIVYSTLLHALGKSGRFDEAFKMILRMKEQNIAPNVVTMSSLLHACGKYRRLNLAFKIYDQMKKSESAAFRPNSITCSSLVDVCLKMGDVEGALSVVNDMRELGLPLTEYTYTSLITELTKLKKLDRILEFAMDYNDDQHTHVPLNARGGSASAALFPNSARTITGLTRSVTMDDGEHDDSRPGSSAQSGEEANFAESSNIPQLKNFPTSLMDPQSASPISFRQLVANMTLVAQFMEQLLSQSHVVQEKMKFLYDITQVQNRTLTTAESDQFILGFDNATLIWSSQWLVSHIVKYHSNLNKDLRLAIANDQSGPAAMMDKLMMTSQILNNCNSIVKYFDSAASFLKATSLLKSSERSVTVDIMIDVSRDDLRGLFRRRKDYYDVIGNYEEMKSQGIVPDGKLYRQLMLKLYEQTEERSPGMSNSQRQLRHDELFRLYLVFQEMKSHGAQPDAAVYNTLINACAAAGDADRALETMQAMQLEGIPPDVITYTSLIKACSTDAGPHMVDLAEEIFAAMQQRTNHFSTYVAPSIRTFEILMRVHVQSASHGNNLNNLNTSRIWTLLDEIMQRKLTPTTRIYRYCFKAATVENDAEKALAMFLLIQKSTRTSTGTSGDDSMKYGS